MRVGLWTAIVALLFATRAAHAEPPPHVPRGMLVVGAGGRSGPVLFGLSAHAGARVIDPLFVTVGLVDGFWINGDVERHGRIYLLGVEARAHLGWHVYGLATLEAGIGRTLYDAGETKRTIPSYVAESKLGIEIGKHVFGRFVAGGLFRRSDGYDFEYGTQLGVAVELQLGIRAF